MTRPWQPLLVTPTGSQWFIRDNEDGTHTVLSTEDNDPYLEANAVRRNSGDGWSKSRDLRAEGSIPLSMIEKWKHEEGVNVLHPSGHDFLKRKLNDYDWSYLRTSPGKT